MKFELFALSFIFYFYIEYSALFWYYLNIFITEKEIAMEILKIFFISAAPVIEQRGAIPMGIMVYDLNPLIVFITSLLGSILPVPFILLFFNIIFDWMKKYRIFNGINRIIEYKLQKNTPRIEKYKEIGLIVFVAIPLPTTGLWTGSAVASFIGLDFKKSFFCTVIGGVISAVVLTVLSVAFPNLLSFLAL